MCLHTSHNESNGWKSEGTCPQGQNKLYPKKRPWSRGTESGGHSPEHGRSRTRNASHVHHQASTRDDCMKRGAGAAQPRPQACHGTTHKTTSNHRRTPPPNNILTDTTRLLCNHITSRSYVDPKPLSVMEHSGKGTHAPGEAIA